MPWIRGGKCELSANIFNKRRKYLNLVGGIPMPEIVSGSITYVRHLTVFSTQDILVRVYVPALLIR